MIAHGSDKPDLIEELKAAMMQRNRAQADLDEEMVRLAEVKRAIRERRELLDAREKTLREIEHELLTGESPLPLLAGAARNGRTADDPAPVRGGYDRDVAAAVEIAEARRAARVVGDPSSWRAVPIEDLCAAAGQAGEAVAKWLHHNMDIETAGDLAICLADGWTLEDMRAEGKAAAELAAPLADALATFRVDRGWTAETTWPDGIPAAWLDDDQGGADEAEPAKGLVPMDEHQALQHALRGQVARLEALRPAGATDAEILAIVGEWGTGRMSWAPPSCPYATTSGPGPKFFYGHNAREMGPWPTGKPDLEGEKLAKAVRKLFKIPAQKPAAAARPLHVAAPAGGWNDETLQMAAEDLGIDPLMACICGRCGAARDKSVAAGLETCPACGEAGWGAVIEHSGELVACDPPPAKPARKSDGEPWPGEGHYRDALEQAGYRPATRAEYRAAAKADRHPKIRAVLSRSGNAVTPAIIETRPDGSAIDDDTARLARRAADRIEADAVRRFGGPGGGINPGAERAHRAKRARGRKEAAVEPTA